MEESTELDIVLENDEALTQAQQLEIMKGDIAEIHAILAPLREVIESLPEAMSKVTPLIEAAKESPVLKMLGIRIP